MAPTTRTGAPAALIARRRPPSLAEAFDPRHNALDAVRLGLALCVAVVHGLVISTRHQPSVRGTDLADLAVDAFFVVSGFLVVRSWERLRSLRRYAWHRALRIFPGYWVCLLVTAFVVAPLAASLSGRESWSVLSAERDPAWSYPLANASLLVLQYPIAGLAEGTGAGGTFDGSLWTLKYEVLCYGVVALMGLVGALAARGHQAWVLPLLCTGVWAWYLASTNGHLVVPVPALALGDLLRFLLVFLLGALAHQHAARIPVHAGLAVAAVALLAVSILLLERYALLGAAPLAYLCLWAAVRLPLPRPRWDLSYGVYVYHWPIQVLVALAGGSTLHPAVLVAASLTMTVLVAAVSWRLVEAPALRLKDVAWSGSRQTGRGRQWST